LILYYSKLYYTLYYSADTMEPVHNGHYTLVIVVNRAKRHKQTDDKEGHYDVVLALYINQCFFLYCGRTSL